MAMEHVCECFDILLDANQTGKKLIRDNASTVQDQ